MASYVFNPVKRKVFDNTYLTAVGGTASLADWVGGAAAAFKAMLLMSNSVVYTAPNTTKEAKSIGSGQTPNIGNPPATNLDEHVGTNYTIEGVNLTFRDMVDASGSTGAAARGSSVTSAATNQVQWTSLGNGARADVGPLIYRRVTGSTLYTDDMPICFVDVTGGAAGFSPGGSTVTIQFNSGGIWSLA